MTVPFDLSAFADSLASDAGLKLSLALVHFLWQGVLIAAAAAVLMRFVGLRSPRRRYLIGVAAMALMAVAPIATFCLVEPPDWSSFAVEDESAFDFSSMESDELELLLATLETGDDVAPGVISDLPARPLTWPERVRLYQPYALMLWLFGTGLCALRLGIGLQASWRFGRKRRALPVAWQEIAARVAGRLCVRAPRVFVSDRIVEAVAVGLLKPMVLLPAAWVGSVPLDVLEAVLAHELAHLRRHDLWVNLLQRCVEAALFYHPAVWWLSRRIRVEREYCCDEMAATTVSGRAAYARALEFVAKERVASTRRPKLAAALAAGMGGSRMALLDRVRRVLGSDARPSRGTWLSEGLLALAVPAALWAGIATVAPAVATADEKETAQKSDEDSSADARIGDADYWKAHGIEAGMITVLKDGQLVDLATGEVVEDNVLIDLGKPGGPTAVPVPLQTIRNPSGFIDLMVERPLPHRDGDVADALRELREEMKSLRKELDEVREGGAQKTLEAALESRKESERMKAALERRISIQLAEAPLEVAIRKFREESDVNLVIDTSGLDEEGVTTDTPVSLDLNDVTIRAALNTLLSPLNLGVMVEDEVVTITSRLRTQGPMEVQTYPVADLVELRDASEPTSYYRSLETLSGLITGTIEPGSWENVGGNGVIRPSETTRSLVIRQTRQVHDQIADLLGELRTLEREKISGVTVPRPVMNMHSINRTHKSSTGGSSTAADGEPAHRTGGKPSAPATSLLETTNPLTATAAPPKPAAPPLPATLDTKINRLLRVVPLDIDGEPVQVIVEEFREGEGPAKEIRLRVLKHAAPGVKVHADPAAAEEAREQEKQVEASKRKIDEEIRARHEQIERIEQALLKREADEASQTAAAEAAKAREFLNQARRRLAPDHPQIHEAQERLRAAEENAARRQIIDAMRKEHPNFPPEILEREVEKLIEARRAQAAAAVKARDADSAQKHAEELRRKLEEQAKVIEELRNELRKARSNPSVSPYQPRTAPQRGDAGEPAEEQAPAAANEQSDQTPPASEPDEAAASEKDRQSTAPTPFGVRFKSPTASAETSRTFSFHVGFVR